MDQYTPSFMTNSKGVPVDRPGEVLRDRADIYGSARLGDAEKYSVKNLMYPNDLMGATGGAQNQYSGSYVMFYLNVMEDSKLLKDPNNVTMPDAEVVRGARGEAIGRNYSTETVAGGTAGLGAFGGLGGGAIVSSIARGGLVGAGIGAGVGAIAAGAVATQTPSFSRPQKRLRAAIALHVPNQLNVRYTTNWSEEETELSSFALEGAATIGRAIDAYRNGASIGSIIDQEKEGVTTAVTSLATKITPNIVQGLTGITSNPRKEQFFRGVDFRTFIFDYSFFPRNEQEAQNVMNIIYMFKLHMHPEFKGQDLGNFLYVYPSEFDISYFYNNKENLNLHRHTSCVLTEMNIQYAPEGQYTTFSNGISSHINVSLTFKELGILTKEDIKKGL